MADIKAGMKNPPQIKKRIKILNSFLDLGCRYYSYLGRKQLKINPIDLSAQSIQRILVIQLFALGDLLLSLPLIKALRGLCPTARIDFWIGKAWRELGPALPYVDQLVSADSGNIFKTIQVIRDLRGKKYDLAFILYPVLTGSWLAFLVGAKYRLGYTRDFDNRESLGESASFLLTHPMELKETVIHDTERYLDLGRHLGWSLTWQPPFLYPPPDSEIFASRFLAEAGLKKERPLIGLNPNASWPGKRWPGSHFARLADLMIQEQKAEVILFGSKAEKKYVEEVISFMKHKPIISAAGCTSLPEMAALISKCHLFISNDSGPMHLACAMDVPTLAIMGPTRVPMFQPWSSKSRVIHHPLPCTPCQMENTDQCGHFSCIRSIGVEQVYEAAVSLLYSLSDN